jgi:hypothetical protein
MRTLKGRFLITQKTASLKALSWSRQFRVKRSALYKEIIIKLALSIYWNMTTCDPEGKRLLAYAVPSMYFMYVCMYVSDVHCRVFTLLYQKLT